MAPPLVTLLTDFGLADTYVAQVKGVLLSLVPEATVVDATHAIEPGDLVGGCLALESILPHFPAETVHLAVVDPGVGTARLPLAVAADGCFGIGPDNGLLTPLLSRPGARVHVIRAGRFACETVAPTFHGRDLFAPACAHLLAGGAIDELGPPVDNSVRLELPRARSVAGGVDGEVLHVDRFGNCTTSIRSEAIAGRDPAALRVTVAGRDLRGLACTYGEVADGALVALIGSTGRLEIAVCNGSAAEALAVGCATPVVVRW